MNQNQTESKPQDVEQPADEGLDETTCSGLFVEHSNFMWQIWKGDERGHAVIITKSCGKSIGTKHPFRSGRIPAEIEDRLLTANVSQFGIPNAEVSHRDRERQPAADQPSNQP